MLAQEGGHLRAAPEREVDDPPAGAPAHPGGDLVVGVEDAEAVSVDGLDNDRLDPGEILDRLDPLKTEVVGRDVRHGADVAVREGEAFPKDAAARRLEDGDIDRWVAQHHAGAPGAGGVRLDDALLVDVDAARCGEPHRQAVGAQDARHHAGGRGLPVRARDGEDRDAAPRAAVTSTMPPPVSRTGRAISGAMKSMPATSRPTARAARLAIIAFSGWMSSVRSNAVPPVDRLAVSRR